MEEYDGDFDDGLDDEEARVYGLNCLRYTYFLYCLGDFTVHRFTRQVSVSYTPMQKILELLAKFRILV
jgi:hypothetical protein